MSCPDPLTAAAVIAQTAEFAAWHAYNIAQDAAVSIATGIQVGLQTAQLGLYYDAADDAIDERDLKIDAQIAFMQTLEDLKIDQDVPMVNCKKDILTNLGLPTIDMCGSVLEVVDDSIHDARGIERKSELLLQESCGPLPVGWALHDSYIHASKASSYTSGLLANSEKRRTESFRNARDNLVRTAHTGIKSVFSAGETLSKYAQAASIHSGLADLYIQGFNSAGAALGATLGELSGGGTNTTPTITTTGVPLDAGTANDVQGLA